jgi:hypothetical protein
VAADSRLREAENTTPHEANNATCKIAIIHGHAIFAAAGLIGFTLVEDWNATDIANAKSKEILKGAWMRQADAAYALHLPISIF